SIVFFFQAEDGIRDFHVTGVQTCALPIWGIRPPGSTARSSRCTSAGRRSSSQRWWRVCSPCEPVSWTTVHQPTDRPSAPRRRLGVMGGTFDPIHHGHLVAASEVAASFDLDEVIFVPTGQPWQKTGRDVSPAEDRYLMTVI